MKKNIDSSYDFAQMLELKKQNTRLFELIKNDARTVKKHLQKIQLNYLNDSLEQEEIDTYNFLFDKKESTQTLQKTQLKDISEYLADYCSDMDYNHLPVSNGNRMVAIKKNVYNIEFYPTENEYVLAYDGLNVSMVCIELGQTLTQQQARDLNALIGLPYYVLPKVWAKQKKYKITKDNRNLLSLLPKIALLEIYNRAVERLEKLNQI